MLRFIRTHPPATALSAHLPGALSPKYGNKSYFHQHREWEASFPESDISSLCFLRIHGGGHSSSHYRRSDARRIKHVSSQSTYTFSGLAKFRIHKLSSHSLKYFDTVRWCARNDSIDAWNIDWPEWSNSRTQLQFYRYSVAAARRAFPRLPLGLRRRWDCDASRLRYREPSLSMRTLMINFYDMAASPLRKLNECKQFKLFIRQKCYQRESNRNGRIEARKWKPMLIHALLPNVTVSAARRGTCASEGYRDGSLGIEWKQNAERRGAACRVISFLDVNYIPKRKYLHSVEEIQLKRLPHSEMRRGRHLRELLMRFRRGSGVAVDTGWRGYRVRVWRWRRGSNQQVNSQRVQTCGAFFLDSIGWRRKIWFAVIHVWTTSE